MDALAQNPTNKLPVELVLKIGYYLPRDQKAICRRVCLQWTTIFTDNLLWRDELFQIHRALGCNFCHLLPKDTHFIVCNQLTSITELYFKELTARFRPSIDLLQSSCHRLIPNAPSGTLVATLKRHLRLSKVKAVSSEMAYQWAMAAHAIWNLRPLLGTDGRQLARNILRGRVAQNIKDQHLHVYLEYSSSFTKCLRKGDSQTPGNIAERIKEHHPASLQYAAAAILAGARQDEPSQNYWTLFEQLVDSDHPTADRLCSRVIIKIGVLAFRVGNLSLLVNLLRPFSLERRLEVLNQIAPQCTPSQTSLNVASLDFIAIRGAKNAAEVSAFVGKWKSVLQQDLADYQGVPSSAKRQKTEKIGDQEGA